MLEKLFEGLFENFINDGIMTKTDRCLVYFGGGASDIYKVKRGYKVALKEVLKEEGFEILRDKEEKVDIIQYNHIPIGCIE